MDRLREFLAVTKALADEGRVRILLALRRKELCVCQIVELLELAPSTVSKHLALLKQARLLQSRKVGRWIFCGLERDDAAQEVAGWVHARLRRDPQVLADARRLREILEIDPEILCRKQRCEP